MKLGYTVFWVEDAEKTAQYYEQVFGLKRRFQTQTPLTPWIEIETGETALAFAQFSEADVLFSGNYRRHDSDEAPVASVISLAKAKTHELTAGAPEITPLIPIAGKGLS